MTVDLIKSGDRVTTPKHGAGTVTTRDVCNDAWPGQPPRLITLNRWGVKLDDAHAYSWFKNGVAYFQPRELKRERIEAKI